MTSHSPSDASTLNPHGDAFYIANLQEVQLLKQVCNCSATYSCWVLVKLQKERGDDHVINFLRDLIEEFAQLRYRIMMLVLLPSIAKSFALILQQERKFCNPSSSHFAQVRSHIMMLVSFLSIVKSFALVLQQEREFGNPSSLHFVQIRFQIMMFVPRLPSRLLSFSNKRGNLTILLICI